MEGLGLGREGKEVLDRVFETGEVANWAIAAAGVRGEELWWQGGDARSEEADVVGVDGRVLRFCQDLDRHDLGRPPATVSETCLEILVAEQIRGGKDLRRWRGWCCSCGVGTMCLWEMVEARTQDARRRVLRRL